MRKIISAEGCDGAIRSSYEYKSLSEGENKDQRINLVVVNQTNETSEGVTLLRDWVQPFALRMTQLLYISMLLSPFFPPVILLFIAVATVILHRGKWSIKHWPENILFGFLLVTIISWWKNPYWLNQFSLPIGLIPFVIFTFYLMLSFWFRYVLTWDWQDMQRMYLRFWLGGLYVAGIVLIQQLDWRIFQHTLIGSLLDFYNQFRWQSESIRSVGTAGNSNLTAAMLICFALMSIYASSVLKRTWQKIGAFVLFFVYCVSIWCTGSRGAWAGVVIGLLVQVWMTGHRKRTLGLFFLLLGLVIFFPQVIPRNETLIDTIKVRFEVWSTSWEIFRENWLFGTLPIHFGMIFEKKAHFYVYHAHNVFLGVAVEFGIIGFILFMSLVFVTIRRARRWRKAATQKEEKRLAGMLLSQMVALLGHGMYDYPILSPQVGLFFFLSVIIIHIQYERKCLGRGS